MKILFFSLVALFLIACNNDDDSQKNYPNCLQPDIDRILASPPQSPRATIEVYFYQNEDVYVVNTYFPDDFSNVYNSKCEFVCSLGGLNGNQNETCVDWDNANYVETVWTDNR